MEVALTFGSLGDIIALVQLAINLGRAIGVGTTALNGTSAKEYQELRHDLDVLVNVLMQVVSTYQQHELGAPLHVLDRVTKTVVDQLTTLIQDALGHLQSRYGSSLTKEGSGSKAKDVYKRVEWCVREKDQLRILREKLQEGMQRLNLLTTLSARHSARVDNATLLARIDQVQKLCQAEHQQVLEFFEKQHLEHNAQLEKQNEKLDTMHNQLCTTETNSRSLLSLAGDALQGILEVRDLVVSMSRNIISLQISATQTQCMRSLDPTKELSVILEDSLGRHIPIPAEWIDTLEWSTLNTLLVGLFKGKRGQDMVQRQQYALEESVSGRDISSAVPLSQCLRRGMKINMSMIFHEDKLVAGGCPRCHTVVDALEGVNVVCPGPDCGMWFRMQKIVVEAATGSINGAMEFEDVLANKDATVGASIPAEPGDFLRVRLLRFFVEYVQSDAAEMENEYTYADRGVSEQVIDELQGDGQYDSDRGTTTTFYRDRHKRRYVNGKFVRPRPKRNGRYIDTMTSQIVNDRERIMAVPNPPTARTAPVNFTSTPPAHPQTTRRRREYHSGGPYFVDERRRVYTRRAPRSEDITVGYEERKAVRQAEMSQKLKAIVERTKTEIGLANLAHSLWSFRLRVAYDDYVSRME